MSSTSSGEKALVLSVERAVRWMNLNRSKVFYYGRLLQAIGGLIFIFGGWVMGAQRLHLICNGERTSGLVVGYRGERLTRYADTASRRIAYMPLVEYQVGGRTVTFKDWLGMSVAGPTKLPVAVLYDPGNPSNAVIDRPVWNWLPWAPVLVLGTFLFIGGVTKFLSACLSRPLGKRID